MSQKKRKKQLKAEAEQWVQSKIQKEAEINTALNIQQAKKLAKHDPEIQERYEAETEINSYVNDAVVESKETIEVTSTDGVIFVQADVTTDINGKAGINADVGLQDGAEMSISGQNLAKKHELDEFKKKTESPVKDLKLISDEVSSSNFKDVAATSTNNTVTALKNAHEDFTKDVTCASEFSDPREDYEDDREEARTNIKTTNERDLETNIPPSPEKTHGLRYIHGKRMPRLHSVIRNMSSYSNQRPLLRFPQAHGQFLVKQIYAQSPQTSNSNTINANTQLQITASSTTPTHQHEAVRPIRHPYTAAGFRPSAPLIANPYRQHNPNGPLFPHAPHPHDYVPGLYGPNTFISNPMSMHTPRGMYRAELPQIVGTGPGMRPAMRLQRPPIQRIPTHNYGHPPPPSLRHPIQAQSQHPTNIQTQQPATHRLNMSSGHAVTAVQSLRPSRVLINPNFKGGVEAATSKFIKETQYMANVGGPIAPPTKSDEELLRQQEEFINKNRQYIEKKRHERYSPLSGARCSASHSRSRSRSRDRARERSYSPVLKRSGAGGSGYSERDRDREKDRDRERNRERERTTRANSRDRERIGSTSSNINNSNRITNRFRRAGSRELDYNHRVNNYNKRRRSLSPNKGNGRRGNDRDRNEIEEDEETRAYRLEIEKQKVLREKILRDKELKRRRAAEEKLHEEKREDYHQSVQHQHTQVQSSHQEQKLRPLIVTERKIITLKKRSCDQPQQQLPNQPQPGKTPQATSAKIVPEGKRTLTGHLIDGRNNNKNITENVQQKNIEVRELSAPSDDEVELDYDDDDLILEEEDRLLASPIPSPTTIKRSVSRSPQQLRSITFTKSINNKSHKNNNNIMSNSRLVTKHLFNASNRRVVLKSSTTSTTESVGGNMGNRKTQKDYEITTGNHGRHRGGNNSNSSSNHRDHIFDRLDAGNKRTKQEHQRVVIKHS